ncbi:MAG TPA: hypothetical protein VLN49_12175 [Gemmatimonadaceae bacterium]|nr:hypothetical protein [Gemmatimonadaceae bacterium]
MTKTFSPRAGLAVSISLSLCACSGDGAGSTTGVRTPKEFSISPPLAATTAGSSTTFRLTDGAGHAVSGARWRVNGISGGSPGLGVISSAGVYTAPAGIPDGDSVVVTGEVQGDSSVRSASAVFFLPNKTSTEYYVPLLRVVDVAEPAPTRFLVVPPANATSVVFLPKSGSPIPLQPIGAGALTFTLDAGAATSGYVPGTLHNFVGRLDYRASSGASLGVSNVNVNVRDAGMPDVPVTRMAADAQRSPHVLNVRTDTSFGFAYVMGVSRLRQLLGDQFDFIAVIHLVTTRANRGYNGVRNDVHGIGAPIFDISSQWSVEPGRLQGVIEFPIDWFFDGAAPATVHEIGHRWINYSRDSVLGAGGAHWPLSTMGLGVMGISIPGSGAGGQFPWSLTPLGDGTVRVNRATPSDRYTPLDLYLMGLIPADSVPAVQVLPPTTSFSALTDGMILPATTFTIADYIAANGERAPSRANAQRDFTMACLVLTYGRLMTESEMAFFDAACVRGETRTVLTTVDGLATEQAPGFYLATGGRATLTTKLP